MRASTLIIAAIALAPCLWAQAVPPAQAKVLSLGQCLEMAFDNSPELVKAKSSRTIGSAGLQSSASSLLPRLSASSSYTQSGPAGYGIDAGGQPVAGQSGRANSYSTSLNASQSLVDLSNWASFKGSINDYQASNAAYRQSLASLSYRVKDAFYGFIKLRKGLEVARASVNQGQEQVTKARVMHQLGSISRSDLLKFEISLAQNRVALLEARKGLAAGQQALRALINFEGDFDVDDQLALPDTSGPLLSRDSLLAEARNLNPGYRAARERHQASRDYLWAAWFSKLPSLGASYRYGYSDSVQFADSRSWNDHDSWSFSLSLSWNIFDGTATEAQIRKARAQANSAEADWVLAQRNLASEVDQVYIEWQAAREEISLVGDLKLQAEEDFRLTTEKHRLGAASTLDVLTSQVNYNQSQREAVNAICAYYLAQAKMDQLLGKK
jgi:outer membrane protein TolC